MSILPLDPDDSILPPTLAYHENRSEFRNVTDGPTDLPTDTARFRVATMKKEKERKRKKETGQNR